MSMVTYPLNNIEYTAEDAELFHSTRTSGVYATDSFDYSVTGADNSIVIGTGIAWIKNRQFSGKVVAQKEPMSLDMGLPDPTYPRIDAVVIQFNSNKNATEIVVKNGAASSFPIAPEVVRTESLYELHLYHVRREAGSLSISAPNITDLRNNNAYCGLMSDSITQAVDSTLSKNGVAADAAAVGTALSKKAPAGYGLGEYPIAFDYSQIDTLMIPGRYRVNVNTTINNVYVSVAHMEVSAVNEYNVVQTLYTTTCPVIILVRQNYGGVWQPWGCDNPPMVPGVEYRTAERWMGKVVWTCCLALGKFPANATINVPHNITMTYCIRCAGIDYATGTTIPRITKEHSADIYLYSGIDEVTISTTTDFSSREVVVQLWYTKD